jgi:hypothetical protein
MDHFNKHRLNDEAVLRAQERASLRKPSHTLPGDPRRAGRPAPAQQPLVRWPKDSLDS